MGRHCSHGLKIENGMQSQQDELRRADTRITDKHNACFPLTVPLHAFSGGQEVNGEIATFRIAELDAPLLFQL